MLAAFRGNVPFRSFLFVGELLKRISRVYYRSGRDIRFIFVVCAVISNIEFSSNKIAVATKRQRQGSEMHGNTAVDEVKVCVALEISFVRLNFLLLILGLRSDKIKAVR